jgi:hypothetical protein
MLAAVGFVPVAPVWGRSEEEYYWFSLSLVPVEGVVTTLLQGSARPTYFRKLDFRLNPGIVFCLKYLYGFLFGFLFSLSCYLVDRWNKRSHSVFFRIRSPPFC